MSFSVMLRFCARAGAHTKTKTTRSSETRERMMFPFGERCGSVGILGFSHAKAQSADAKTQSKPISFFAPLRLCLAPSRETAFFISCRRNKRRHRNHQSQETRLYHN